MPTRSPRFDTLQKTCRSIQIIQTKSIYSNSQNLQALSSLREPIACGSPFCICTTGQDKCDIACCAGSPSSTCWRKACISSTRLVTCQISRCARNYLCLQLMLKLDSTGTGTHFYPCPRFQLHEAGHSTKSLMPQGHRCNIHLIARFTARLLGRLSFLNEFSKRLHFLQRNIRLTKRVSCS